MLLPDGGDSGIAIPPGDPAALRQAAASLASCGTEMSGITSATSGASTASLAEWQGATADTYSTLSGDVVTALRAMEPAYDQASKAISAYAEVLEQAQAKAQRASTAYEQAMRTWAAATQSGAQQLQGLPSTATAAAKQTIQDGIDQANRTFDEASTAATKLGNQAMQEAEDEARTQAAIITRIAQGIQDETYHKVVESAGWGPMTVGGISTYGGSKAVVALAKTMAGLKAGDYAKFASFDKAGFAAAEQAAATYGEHSAEALKAWLEFGQAASKEAYPGGFAALAKAITTGEKVAGTEGLMDILHNLSGAGAAGKTFAELSVFDKIGRVGVGIGAVGDVMTIIDGKATTTDRALSGANLIGTGMWAAGTEGGAAALDLVGVNAVADWVPGVGEVVMGGTALYLAGEFAYQHWDQIKAAGTDVVHAAEWLSTEEGKLGAEGLQEALKAGKVTVAAIEDGAKVTEQVVATGAKEAVHLAGETYDAAKGVVESGASTVESGAKDVWNAGGAVVSFVGGL